MSSPDEGGPSYEPGRSPFLHRTRKPALQRTFPVAEHLTAYAGQPVLRDLVAGITVGALAIPSAMAYAQLVGVAPVHGLYVLLLPLIVYAFLGSSRQVIIGPEASISGMLAAALVGLGAGDPSRVAGLAATCALLVGACFLVARVARLGWLADYISRAVLVGYLHGVVVVLVVAQLSKITGTTPGTTSTIRQFSYFLTHLGDVHLLSLGVGLVVVAALVILRRIRPRFPTALIVVVLGIVVSEVFDLASRGVRTVGPIPSGLPAFARPALSFGDVRDLLPAALGIFFVSFADSTLTARSFAGLHDQHVDAQQEMLALGVANLAASVTQGFTPSASSSRTAINDQMGARTQIAGLFSVGMVALVLLFLTGPMQYLPTPVLAALIVAAAISIVDTNAWRSIAASGRLPVAIAVVTGIGVILAGILHALLLAIALSVIEVIARGSRPHDAVLGFVPRIDRFGDVRFHSTAVVNPGIVTYRLDDRMFFANASYVTGRINEAVAGAPTETRVLVFDAERVPDIDDTASEALRKLILSLRKRDIDVVLARAGRSVLEQLRRSRVLALLGDDHVQPTVHAGVAAAVRLRDV